MYGLLREVKMSSLKELNKLFKIVLEQGWTIELSHNNHYKLYAPNGKVVFVSSTPSDHRALQNIKRDLRANGLVIVKKNRRK